MKYIDLSAVHRYALQNSRVAFQSIPPHGSLNFETFSDQDIPDPLLKYVSVQVRLVIGQKMGPTSSESTFAYAYICMHRLKNKALLGLGTRPFTVSSLDQVQFCEPFNRVYDEWGMSERTMEVISTLVGYYFMEAGYLNGLWTGANWCSAFKRVYMVIYQSKMQRLCLQHEAASTTSNIAETPELGEDISIPRKLSETRRTIHHATSKDKHCMVNDSGITQGMRTKLGPESDPSKLSRPPHQNSDYLYALASTNRGPNDDNIVLEAGTGVNKQTYGQIQSLNSSMESASDLVENASSEQIDTQSVSNIKELEAVTGDVEYTAVAIRMLNDGPRENESLAKDDEDLLVTFKASGGVYSRAGEFQAMANNNKELKMQVERLQKELDSVSTKFAEYRRMMREASIGL